MKKHVLLGFIVVTGLCGLFLVGSRLVSAGTFNPNFVITDADFTDASSMSADKIQQFLNMQPGSLDTYSTTVNGVVKSAAQIIYDAAQLYQISPKVILTKLQQEEGLLSIANPSQVRMDWAMGCSVKDGMSAGTTSKGFYNQIQCGTSYFRKYLTQMSDPRAPWSVSGWGPGISKNTCNYSPSTSDGCVPGTQLVVTPVNQATAALYTYTPHPAGAQSFWVLWNQYNFGVRRLYPDGSVLQAKGTNDIYVIQYGVKRKFVSMAAFLSRYTYNNVIKVNADQLFFYDDGTPIKFANYSLLKNPTGGIYLLVDDTIRPIKNKAAFKAAGFVGEPTIKVSWADLLAYTEGTPITVDNIYPSGRLMKNSQNGMIFYVQDGVRHPIPSTQIYKSQFGLRRAASVKPATLNTYTWGTPVGFKDGELVQLKGANKKGTGPVYFISNGQKLPIDTPSTAKAYNFNLANVILTNQASLDVHPTGQTLTTDPTPVVQSASQ